MDQLDDLLAEFFSPAALVPAGLAARLARRGATARDTVADLARFHFAATDRGVCRLSYGAGRDSSETALQRRHITRAREELAEYLTGARTYFSVPFDLRGIGAFQAD